MANLQTLSIGTFYMHGFHSSCVYLKDLLNSHDIMFVQEHWLIKDNLNKFNTLNSDVVVYAKSAMDVGCSSGTLAGRPYGGVAVLWNKKLGSSVNYCGSDDYGRVLCISVNCGNNSMLCFGVYLPCLSTLDYDNKISDVIGFILAIVQSRPGCSVMILGDFNFPIDVTNIRCEGTWGSLSSDMLYSFSLVS